MYLGEGKIGYRLNDLSSQLQFNSNMARTGVEPAVSRKRGGRYMSTATADRCEQCEKQLHIWIGWKIKLLREQLTQNKLLFREPTNMNSRFFVCMHNKVSDIIQVSRRSHMHYTWYEKLVQRKGALTRFLKSFNNMSIWMWVDIMLFRFRPLGQMWMANSNLTSFIVHRVPLLPSSDGRSFLLLRSCGLVPNG